jgi:hypothetical protein
MSVHFHPSYPNLLAVGCYDGSVAVFDARARGGAPLYQATARSGKHNDAVWQVQGGRKGTGRMNLCGNAALLLSAVLCAAGPSSSAQAQRTVPRRAASACNAARLPTGGLAAGRDAQGTAVHIGVN